MYVNGDELNLYNFNYKNDGNIMTLKEKVL